MRNDVIAAYRKHLELMGRAKHTNPVTMTIEELKERINMMNDDEILEISFDSDSNDTVSLG